MSVSSLTYDNMYRVTGKSQHLSQTGVQFDGTLSAGYDLKYTYSGEEGKRFQLAGVDDVNYSAETVMEESKVVNAHAYEYDANGNLVFINTSRTKKDGQTTPNAGERKLKWDEENRLTASDDNGFVTSYWYDASGERTVKSSGENAAMFVNAEFAGGTTNTAKFSLYVSPYLVANQGGRYTKHIYIGSQRIVSKLGDLKSYGADPRRIEYAGSESDGPKVDYKTKYAQQQQVIKDNFAHFDVPYNGADNNDYVDGKGFSERDGSLKGAMLKAASLKDNFQQGDSYEQYQYFYHPDHLGSSSFITNTEGEVVQHIEYVPYGEVFIEERNNVWNTPYLFNAKEFDEETGLYYYGARYYDSRLAIWYGVDALTEKYPNMGGYVYCAGNPVRFVDVDGRKIVITNEDGTVLEYSVGMEYQGNDDFVKETVEYLNAMSKVKAGYEVLSYVSDSEKRFNFVNAPSKAGSNSFQFVKYKSGNGGNIRASAFVVSNMSEANKVEGVAHELFHAYQFINGRNIASANAEVEAYLFGNGVAANSKFGSEYYPYVSGNLSQSGRKYEESMLLLITDPQDFSKFFHTFSIAVENFQKGNISSYRDKYRSNIDVQYVPLIQQFLPLR